MFDYHVHSDLSFDCETPMRVTCEAAVANGLTEIAFTDHVDFEPVDPSTGYYDSARYWAELDAVRAEYGDRLVILSGAEVDFNTETAPRVERFLRGHRFDIVIGSVHCFLESGRAELVYPEIFAGRTSRQVYVPYLEQVRAAAATGWFDTIGHMDFPKRYAPETHHDYDPLAYRDQFEAIFAELMRTGTVFEINTSGLRKAGQATLPGPAVVRWYVEAGGTSVTVGSDSHEAATVGAGLPQTLAMLHLCGIESVQSFRNRHATPVPIAAVIASDRRLAHELA